MKKYYSFLLIITLVLCSCSLPNVATTPTNSKTDTQTNTPTIIEPKCPICKELPQAVKTSYPELALHTPTTFDVTSVNSTEKILCEGVTQKTWTFNKNNGNPSQVVTIEVDLNLASIAAGTYENQTSNLELSTVYNHALFYEAYNTDRMVVAATNADYFGGNRNVNAFVKDSIIIKDSHNDNGVYDYKQTQADLPASMPMLFGVSGNVAQVAPIVKNASVKDTVQSKLSYQLELLRNDTSSYLTNQVVINKHNEKQNVNIVYDVNMQASAYASSIALKMKKHVQDTTRIHGEIIEITPVTEYTAFPITEEEYYIIVPDTIGLTDFQIGDVLSYYITSPDDTWKYYDTILGCRHALVIDGEIPDTVALEYSNGAKSGDVPRTSVGVMPNGNVVIFSVESLRYGEVSSSTSDPYGLNLSELADFMRYYGIYSGANFDGGGSTQLITKNSETNSYDVIIRSSDFGTTGLFDSRAVINSILVTKKYE